MAALHRVHRNFYSGCSGTLGPNDSVAGPNYGNRSSLSFEIQLQQSALFSRHLFPKRDDLIGLIFAKPQTEVFCIIFPLKVDLPCIQLIQFSRARIWIQGNCQWWKVPHNTWYVPGLDPCYLFNNFMKHVLLLYSFSI